MNESIDDVIRPATAPLSHLSKQTHSARSWLQLDWRSIAMVVVVVGVAMLAIFWRPQPVSLDRPVSSGLDAPASAENAVDSSGSQLAPFAETQRARAREKAQAALARFVEQQILLEDTMQVASWGAQELAEALALAKAGDEAFVKEQFTPSLESYDLAVTRLQQLVVRGDDLFIGHLDAGKQYLADLDPVAANQALEKALTIKPNEPAARQLLQRAQMLPEIIVMLRTAKNHELGGRFVTALQVYDEVAQLDPQTMGLQAARDAVAAAQAGDNLTSYISQGFAALERQDFTGAKSAFNKALALDSNNDIAKGGLQQVAKDNDLAIIQRLRVQAENSLAKERWQPAIDAYSQVLKLDANIQFARTGLQTARAHLRSQQLLQKIADEPQKLSSEKLYLDAQSILAEAKTLTFSGPVLDKLSTTVEDLLITYRDPVDLVLISDNATNIIVSNVGTLGVFERKTLTLRPGAYTIRGSQDGCRDIFLNIEVLPGIAPLQVQCAETIQR